MESVALTLPLGLSEATGQGRPPAPFPASASPGCRTLPPRAVTSILRAPSSEHGAGGGPAAGLLTTDRCRNAGRKENACHRPRFTRKFPTIDPPGYRRWTGVGGSRHVALKRPPIPLAWLACDNCTRGTRRVVSPPHLPRRAGSPLTMTPDSVSVHLAVTTEAPTHRQGSLRYHRKDRCGQHPKGLYTGQLPQVRYPTSRQPSVLDFAAFSRRSAKPGQPSAMPSLVSAFGNPLCTIVIRVLPSASSKVTSMSVSKL